MNVSAYTIGKLSFFQTTRLKSVGVYMLLELLLSMILEFFKTYGDSRTDFTFYITLHFTRKTILSYDEFELFIMYVVY